MAKEKRKTERTDKTAVVQVTLSVPDDSSQSADPGVAKETNQKAHKADLVTKTYSEPDLILGLVVICST